MNAHAAIDAQRRSWELAAGLVARAGAAEESLVALLTAEVGQTPSDVVYRENKLELRHYEPDHRCHETPVLVVYALVNRPYILDLQPDRSVVRRLLEAGFSVYLIDWGEPSRLDAALAMQDYVDRYLDNCVDVVRAREGVDDTHLLGYCMGGSMALIYAALHGPKVRTLGLMATPVAFEGNSALLERWVRHYDPDVVVETLGNVPAELLAVGFSMLNPIDQYVSKYVRLYENADDPEFVANWARMERWIWDGVDLAGEAYREFVVDLYKRNQLIEGEYELAGRPVRLGDVEVPVLGIVGEHDHIVPAESSRPLHDHLGSEDETLIEFPRGHIGLSVSGKAHEMLWPAVCEWYAERDAGTDTAGRPAAVDDGADADTPRVEAVDGIGPTYAGRLREAGIETAVDLAEHDAQLLAALTDAPRGRVEGWLDRIESQR